MADTDPASPSAAAFDQLRAGLSTLPPEIFDDVARNLTGRDLKALRLVQTNNDPTIVRHLFRRVRLSILNYDRHVFLTIASQPHLAKNVRVLEWFAYPNDTEDIEEWLNSVEPEFGKQQLRKLTQQFTSVCWADVFLAPDPAVMYDYFERIEESEETLMTALDDFQPILAAAITAMPQIHDVELQAAFMWRPVGIPELDTPLAAPYRTPPPGKRQWSQHGEIAHDFLRYTVEVERCRRWPSEKASTSLTNIST